MDLSGSWEYIERIARSRLANNKTPHHVSEYGEIIELIGVAGELAARRFLGLNEVLHTGFDGGCDFTYAGKRIDVKATVLTPNVKYRNMQWPTWKKVKADYVLMTAVDPVNREATIIGYASREEIENAPINNQRNIPCHEITFEALHPVFEIVGMELRRRMDESTNRSAHV